LTAICAVHKYTIAVHKIAAKGMMMRDIWHTKYGPRRVRHDPPTLAEAIDAASGLSDDPQDQVEIAAALMQVPAEQVRIEMARASARKVATVSVAARSGLQRAVVVERKTPRRAGIKRYVV
jgi:hypothetical protein